MLGTESTMTLNFTHHRSFGIRLGGESLREDLCFLLLSLLNSLGFLLLNLLLRRRRFLF